MAEQYEHGWRDPRKMSRRELEDWAALHSTWPPTDRNIPEWTDWRPKLMVPRWLVILMYGMLLITFTAQWAYGQDPVPFEDPCPSGTCRVFNQAVIWSLTGDERSLQWTQDQDNLDTMDLFFRVEGHDFPPQAISVPFMTGEYPEGTNLHLWTPQRAGFYFFQVRACRTDILQDGSVQDSELRPGTTDEWMLCSVWAMSHDSTYTDSVKYPRGFTMIVQLAPATGGVIE